jgi:hypothetical protein
MLRAVPSSARTLLPLLVLVLACAGKTKRDQDAANEAATTQPSERDHPSARSLAAKAKSERPIAVVELEAGDARPCERMCGRIGDCLLSDEGRDASDARGVEFACLDTCVYADPEQPAAREFQACDAASACGELLGCARGRWDAATAARKTVEVVAPITVIRDTCESACLTLQACNWYYRMPDQIDGMTNTDFYNAVNACTEGCRYMEQTYLPYAECVGETSCEMFYQCASRQFGP